MGHRCNKMPDTANPMKLRLQDLGAQAQTPRDGGSTARTDTQNVNETPRTGTIPSSTAVIAKRDNDLISRRKATGLYQSAQPSKPKSSSGLSAGPSVARVDPPEHFEIHRIDSTHVKLSWRKVPGATHYVVHNLTSGGSTGRSQTEAILSGLEPGHEYAFSVSSADRYGQSKPGSEQKVMMPDDVEGSTGVRKSLRRKLNQTTAELSELTRKLKIEESKNAGLVRQLATKQEEYQEHLSEKDRIIDELKKQLGQAPPKKHTEAEKMESCIGVD